MASVSTPNQCTLQPCGVTLCSSLNRRSIHTTRLRAIPLVRPCGMIRVRAVAEGEPKPVIRRKRTAPYPSPDAAPKPDVDEIVPTVMVEDYGVSVEGVAKVDREGPSARPSWGWESFFFFTWFLSFLWSSISFLTLKHLKQRDPWFEARKTTTMAPIKWCKSSLCRDSRHQHDTYKLKTVGLHSVMSCMGA